jgi:hypothetical protein
MVGPNPAIGASNNRIEPRTSPVEHYAYDSAGNLTDGQSGDEMDYNADNKMVRYQGGATQTGGADYSYDGDGRRVKKATPAETLRIDFGDFDRVGGDKEAYSVGLVAIHEFDHKLYNVSDYPNGSTDPGKLERDYINPIRRQLGLPERLHYVSEPLPAAYKNIYPGGGNQIRFQLNGKEKVLRWRNDLVGGKVAN